MTHSLKTWPEWFSLTEEGKKTFELRFNDRGFKQGDTLILMEYDPKKKAPTGRELKKKVGYIIENTSYIAPGYILMSLCDCDGNE